MVETPLTKEQQVYAAEHHGLIYAFLDENNLSDDDFYDIVIFGYLKAVKEYLANFRLNKKYEFSTIAFKHMKSVLCKHYTKQNRKKRSGITISFEAVLYGENESSLQDILSLPDDLMIDFEVELLLLELASRISKREMDVIRMKAEGYGVREIAKKHKMPMKGVKELLAGLRETVLAVCYKQGG